MANEKMNEIRAEIDKIDHKIMRLLSLRREQSLAMGKIKKELQLPIKDSAREEVVLDKVSSYAKDSNLDINLIRQIFTLLIADSVALQEKELGDN